MQRNHDRIVALKAVDVADQYKSIFGELEEDEGKKKKVKVRKVRISKAEAARNRAKKKLKSILDDDSDDPMKEFQENMLKKSLAFEDRQETSALTTQQKVAMYIEEMEKKKREEEEERRKKEQLENPWYRIFSVPIDRYRAYQARFEL